MMHDIIPKLQQPRRRQKPAGDEKRPMCTLHVQSITALTFFATPSPEKAAVHAAFLVAGKTAPGAQTPHLRTFAPNSPHSTSIRNCGYLPSCLVSILPYPRRSHVHWTRREHRSDAVCCKVLVASRAVRRMERGRDKHYRIPHRRRRVANDSLNAAGSERLPD